MSDTNHSRWPPSLRYSWAVDEVEATDEETADLMRDLWNARVRAARAQAGRAKAKASPFDAKVRSILSNVEKRRGSPVPPRERTSLVARAIWKESGGNPDSIRRKVRRSLERLGLR